MTPEGASDVMPKIASKSEPRVTTGRTLGTAVALTLLGSLCIAPAIAAGTPSGVSNTPKHNRRPIDRSGRVQTGVASFYGKGAGPAKTASGVPLNPSKSTAASRTLPMGTKAKVINEENGRSTAVTITDRGPYAKNRILDVSPRAASQLGMTADGVSKVQVVPVQEPPVAKPAPSTK